MKRYIPSALWAVLLCLCLAFTGGTVYAQDKGGNSSATSAEKGGKGGAEKENPDADKLKELQAKEGLYLKEINELKRQRTTLISEKETLTKTNKALLKQIKRLQIDSSSLQTLRSKDVVGVLERLRNDSVTIQKRLDTVAEKIKELGKENVTLQEQNKANQMPPFATIVLVGALIVCLVLLFLQVGRVKQLKKRLAVAPSGTVREGAQKSSDSELRTIIQRIEASEKRVLEALQQSENLSQIALTNFANDLRQQIRTEEPRVTTKASKKEESQPDHTQQTLYQYFLYACKHQCGNRIINHWFIINWYQLFAYAFCNWIKAST